MAARGKTRGAVIQSPTGINDSTPLTVSKTRVVLRLETGTLFDNLRSPCIGRYDMLRTNPP